MDRINLPIMTKWKTCLFQKQKLKSAFYKSYSLEASLTSITALSLYSLCSVHLDLGRLRHSFWQVHSSSIRLDAKHLFTPIFASPQMFFGVVGWAILIRPAVLTSLISSCPRAWYRCHHLASTDGISLVLSSTLGSFNFQFHLTREYFSWYAQRPPDAVLANSKQSVIWSSDHSIIKAW